MPRGRRSYTFERAAPSAADPPKKMDFEFKFTVKLKLEFEFEFEFDFDLISGSNFNKVGVKVAQISTHRFQI